MAQVLDLGNPTADADQALGRWVSKAQDSQTEIFKSGNRYYGRLLAGWGNELYEKDGQTLRKDTKNPDAALRTQPLFNAVILSNLEYQDGEYQNGRYLRCADGQNLWLHHAPARGRTGNPHFVKFKLLGMTKKWTRVPR